MSRRIVMMVLFMLVVGLVRPVGAQTDEIDRAREESERAREDVFEAQAEVDAALDRIAEAQFRADEATARFWEAQSALYALEEDIAFLDTRISTATAELDELRAEVREIAVDAFIETGRMPSVFESEDLNSHARNQALARFATDTRRDVVDEFRIARDELSATQEQMAARLAEQETAIGTAADARAEIDAELAVLAEELETMEEAVAVREAILGDFEAEERRLVEEELQRQAEEEARRRAEEEARRRAAEAEAARIAAEQEAARQAELARQQAENGGGDQSSDTGGDGTGTVPPPVSAPAATGWVCPVAGPFTHVDDFWAPRVYGGVHRANDLIADTGVPVIAVVGGEAEFRGGNISGLAVRVDGDNGDWFFYGHLSAYENPERTYVEAGSVIGYVGETGNAPIPHLHFEWHVGGYGNYANPYPVVAATC